MWIMTQDGFFSVVARHGKDERLTVRARSRADLDRLHKRYPTLVPALDSNAEYAANRDYPWRVVMSRNAFARVMSAEVIDLDYSNFKNAVAKRLGNDREDTYHTVWDVLRDIEGEPDADVRRRRMW